MDGWMVQSFDFGFVFFLSRWLWFLITVSTRAVACHCKCQDFNFSMQYAHIDTWSLASVRDDSASLLCHLVGDNRLLFVTHLHDRAPAVGDILNWCIEYSLSHGWNVCNILLQPEQRWCYHEKYSLPQTSAWSCWSPWTPPMCSIVNASPNEYFVLSLLQEHDIHLKCRVS